MSGGDFLLLPPTASTAATHLNWLMLALTLLMGTTMIVVSVALVAFCIRYRRGARVDRSHAPTRSRGLELVWSIAPLLIFLGIYAWAAHDFLDLARVPADAMPVYVVAKQWMWKLEHANGRREISELHVPIGRPVRLVMTSQDVIHSFYVPAFRIKQDVVPGRYTSAWVQATQAGEYDLFCAEYCGTQHSLMRGKIVAMAPADFTAWLDRGTAQPGMAQRGFALVRSHGCEGCHGAQSSVHAPKLEGITGTEVALADGRRVVADDTYLRDSILLPSKDVVAGYAPIMPSYAGQIDEADLMAIIRYLHEGADAHGGNDDEPQR